MRKYRLVGTASTCAPANGIIPICLIRALPRSHLFQKSGGRQILYFDFHPFDEIFGSVLYNDDPANRSDRKKGKPEQQTEITHVAEIVLSFEFWVLRFECTRTGDDSKPKLKTQNF
jgi:hypothetical protein